MYVLDSVPDGGTSIVDGATPVAEADDIGGDVTFDLGGADGRVVVLWITRTGAEGTVTVTDAVVEVDG